MRLFGQSTPFDADVDKVTSETNTDENWALIMDVCDKVSSNPRYPKECLKAVMKRMGHPDPHIVMQAITLLDALASNCGKQFHLEIASREFDNEFRRLLAKAMPAVATKMRQLLKNWAENDFKNDPQLNLIPSMYNRLRQEGMDFSNLNEKPTKAATKMVIPKDPNVVSSQQEEDDIAKAIELSLKESTKSSSSPKLSSANATASAPNMSSAYPSLYPSFGNTTTSGTVGGNTTTTSNSSTQANAPAAPPAQQEPRKVRALYDFEAAEDNELSFTAGEIIHVLDDSDANWWKGFNQQGDGLFPSNFVTADLSVDPERLDINMHNKTTAKQDQQQDDAKELSEKTEKTDNASGGKPGTVEDRIEIDENRIDRLLHLLHEANPEDPSQDTDEMLRLEQEVHLMGPLIDAELERVDRKHAQLTQLSCDLVDAINLYHSLMRDDRSTVLNSAVNYRQSAPNPQVLYGATGYPGTIPGSVPGGAFASQSGNPPIPSYGYGPHTVPPPDHTQQVTMQMKNEFEAQQRMSHPQMFGVPQPHLPATQSANYPMSAQQQQQHLMSIPQQFGNGVSLQATDLAGMPGAMGPAPAPAPTQQQQLQANPASFISPQHGPFISQQQQQQQQHPQPQHPQMPYGGPTSMPNGIGPSPMPNGTTGPTMSLNYLQHAPLPQSAVGGGMMTQGGGPPIVAAAYNNNNGVNNVNGSGALMPNASNNNADQYSQLQQQMAAMSMVGGSGGGAGAIMMGGGGGGGGVGGAMAMMGGGGIGLNHHQPVTQSFLVQNEPKNNIPIYQQQR